MASWDEIIELIRQTEESLFHLKLALSSSRWHVLKEAQSGWYTRAYLADRLPAEIARSDRSGRPFGLGLIVVETGELLPGRWRPFLAHALDPAEVVVFYSERALCFLLPERDGAESRRRIAELAESAVVWGLIPLESTRISAVSYPERRESPAFLLRWLERTLEPLASREAPGSGEAGPETREDGASLSPGDDAGEEVTPEVPPAGESTVPSPPPVPPPPPVPSPPERPASMVPGLLSEVPPRSSEPGAGAPDGRPAPAAERAPAAGRVPVAVGFAAERELPVSFWFGGEVHTIDAVLNEEVEGGVHRLTVLTAAGVFELEQLGGRWYAEKKANGDEAAGDRPGGREEGDAGEAFAGEAAGGLESAVRQDDSEQEQRGRNI